MANRLETDVLVIGGGIAGCCAATRAADKGLNVILLEKSHTKRSGCAGQGIDHYESVPQGAITPRRLTERFEEEQSRMNGDRVGDPNLMHRYFEAQWDTIHGLEDLGVPMKWYDGEYYFFNRADMFPGERYWLRVNWTNVKPLLSKAVRERGVKVLERTMAVDLLTDGDQVVGAAAYNTRTGEFTVIEARATIVATGQLQRVYQGEEPLSGPYTLRYDGCPATQSGDGYAMAYRAGANLANMDINGWNFRARDDLVVSFGNFEHGDGLPSCFYTADGQPFEFADAQVYRKYEEEGRTPLYRWLNHLPDDYVKRMELCFVDEKLIDFKFAEDRRFNPHTHAFEVTPFKPLSFMASTGIHVGEDLSTRLKGLFAIGDVASPLHSCSVAAGTAFLLADSLPDYVNSAKSGQIDDSQVEQIEALVTAPLRADKPDTGPLEVESAIRYICERYVGLLRTEGKMHEGLRRLGSLRRLVMPRVKATTPHEIMRYLEVRNLMDMAEVHINACLLRKESRGNFMRPDYPDRDPSRDGVLTHQRLDQGRPVHEFFKVPELRPELGEEV